MICDCEYVGMNYRIVFRTITLVTVLRPQGLISLLCTGVYFLHKFTGEQIIFDRHEQHLSIELSIFYRDDWILKPGLAFDLNLRLFHRGPKDDLFGALRSLRGSNKLTNQFFLPSFLTFICYTIYNFFFNINNL